VWAELEFIMLATNKTPADCGKRVTCVVSLYTSIKEWRYTFVESIGRVERPVSLDKLKFFSPNGKWNEMIYESGHRTLNRM